MAHTIDTKDHATVKRLMEVGAAHGAHLAMAYRDWLEGKIGAARSGLADGSNQAITDKAWARARAVKLKQRAAAK